MIWFIILELLTILLYPLLKSQFKRTYKKKYCIIEFVLILLLMGLRIRSTAGTDTEHIYYFYFQKFAAMNYADVAFLVKKDYLFFWGMKAFDSLCSNFQVYIFVISCIVTGGVSYFIYKYSKNPQLSYIIYFALGYYGISFQLLRHSIALTILLFSYRYILDNKIVKFILIVAFAALFHSSALVFVFAYPLYKVRLKRKQFIIVSGFVLASVVLKNQILIILKNLFGAVMQYSAIIERQTTIGISGAFILLSVYLLSYCLVYSPKKVIDSNINGLLNFSMMSTCLMFLVGIIGEFHRISMFYGMYNLILLPNALSDTHRVKGKSALIILALMEMVFVLYFIIFGLENAGLLNFRFFWQI